VPPEALALAAAFLHARQPVLVDERVARDRTADRERDEYALRSRPGSFVSAWGSSLAGGVAAVTAAVLAWRSSDEQAAPSAPAEHQPAQPEPGSEAPAAPEE
jgi:hypothetical protein